MAEIFNVNPAGANPIMDTSTIYGDPNIIIDIGTGSPAIMNVTTSGGPAPDALLMESGDFLLQESGDFILLE